MNVESLISSIVVGVIGLAIVAVLVSQRANTAKVIGASSSGLADIIGAAVAPVTGAGSGGILGATGGLPITVFNNAFGH